MKIQTWGNSAAIRIPAVLLQKLNMQIGQELDAAIVDGSLILKPAKPQYSLSVLVALCDSNTDRDKSTMEWDQMNPVGNESW